MVFIVANHAYLLNLTVVTIQFYLDLLTIALPLIQHFEGEQPLD